MESLLQKFGVTAEETQLIERQESVILRIAPTRYIRKQSSRFVDTSGPVQLAKLELSLGGRISKAFQLYIDTNSEIYKELEAIYAKAVDQHLVDVPVVNINQYKR